MREIEFRGRSKSSNKWIYGSLIVKKKKRRTKMLDKELYEYKYSIQTYSKKSGKYYAREVKEETIGQFVGEGEYGRIYEGMKLYDEYAEEECSIEWIDDEAGFRLCYNGNCDIIESLDGLIIIEEE